MDFFSIISNYWAQLSLLLLGIGYFVKIILQTLTNKKEINHNIFQQNKIDSIKCYLDCYSESYNIISRVSFENYAMDPYRLIEYEKIFFPATYSLSATTFRLRMFFNDKTYDEFEKISNIISSLFTEVNMILVQDDDFFKNYDDIQNVFNKNWQKKHIESNEILDSVLKKIRKSIS